MAQWINVLQNNSFVNPMQLPLLCRNSRVLTLAQPGLLADWLAGLLADKMHINFEFLKFIIDQFFKLLLHLTNLQHYSLMHLS